MFARLAIRVDNEIYLKQVYRKDIGGHNGDDVMFPIQVPANGKDKDEKRWDLDRVSMKKEDCSQRPQGKTIRIRI